MSKSIHDEVQTAWGQLRTNKALHDDLQQAWAHFTQLAARAEQEAKYTSDGRPAAETDYALATLSDKLDKLEAQLSNPPVPGRLFHPEGTKSFVLNGETLAYEVNTAEHARFLRYLRSGVTSSDYTHLTPADLSETTREHLKSMSLANDTTGGFLASDQFASDVLRRSVDVSPARRVARVVTLLQPGPNLLIPVRGPVNAAVRVSETGSRAPSATFDLSFALSDIPCSEMLCSTKMSRQLLSDAAYPLDSELAQAAAESFALKEGTEFIKGNGVGQMLGLEQAALPEAQIQTTTGTSHTIAAADVFDLIDKLKPQYLPNAQFLCSATTMLAIRKLRGDGTNGPLLYQPGLGGLVRGTICDFPYQLCADMGDPGSSAIHVMFFGDFAQAYAIAVQQAITVIRLNELYAESGQVGFLVLQRNGGQPVNLDALTRMTTGA